MALYVTIRTWNRVYFVSILTEKVVIGLCARSIFAVADWFLYYRPWFTLFFVAVHLLNNTKLNLSKEDMPYFFKQVQTYLCLEYLKYLCIYNFMQLSVIGCTVGHSYFIMLFVSHILFIKYKHAHMLLVSWHIHSSMVFWAFLMLYMWQLSYFYSKEDTH